MGEFTQFPIFLQSTLAQQFEQRKAVSKRPGSIKIRKGVNMKFPHPAENNYTDQILAVVNRMYRDFLQKIRSVQPLLNQQETFRPDSVSDAPADDIDELFEEIRIGFEDVVPDSELLAMAKVTGTAISEFNRDQVRKVIESRIGVDPFISEPWLAQELQLFNRQNVALIKSIPERFYNEVEEITFRGFRNGLRFEEIAEQYRERYNIAKNRARLIARDQTEKLNGQLNRLRQQSLGIKRYTWRTVGDSRVRREHALRDSKIFEWAKPPIDGHPGEPINCRCWAEPVLKDIINVGS